MAKKPLYVVLMHRWGDNHKHTYLLGVWTSENRAKIMGVSEEAHRGYKYKAMVLSCHPDSDTVLKRGTVKLEHWEGTNPPPLELEAVEA